MNKMILLAMLVLGGYFCHHQYVAARAFQKLSEVPAHPEGRGGFARLHPTMPLNSYLEQGRHTVFIFSASWCPACQSLEGQLPAFLNRRPDVAVRSIDVSSPETSQRAAQDCNVHIRSIPHVVIYDSTGELVAQDDGSNKSGYEALLRWVNHEAQQAH